LSQKNLPRAKRVLQSLIQGIDPETGGELPKDTILNRVDVIRALLASVEAIEQVGARAARRAMLPPSVGKEWTDQEENQLRAEFHRGDEIANIAAAHGRTIRAIEARLERAGLITAQQRTTNNSFMGAQLTVVAGE
jgi:hypothetical protein